MQNASVAQGAEAPPLDLLTQIERRFDIDREAALAVLGGWISTYKPTARGPICFLK